MKSIDIILLFGTFLGAPVESLCPHSVNSNHKPSLVLRRRVSVQKLYNEDSVSEPLFGRREWMTRSGTSVISLLSFLSTSNPAHASYGDAPKQEGFNYIEFLIEKNKTVKPDDLLYKGSDSEVQLKRILEASKRLEEIPILAGQRKWSQIQGILTGPLGTLLQTMTFVVGSVNGKGAKDAKAALGKVKGDIILIGQEASKKSESGCIMGTQEARDDLEAFVKIAF